MVSRHNLISQKENKKPKKTVKAKEEKKETPKKKSKLE